MANLIRSAKPSNSWSAYELTAYNITVIAQSPQEFFRRNPTPPLDDLDPLLINSTVDAVDHDAVDVADDTFHYFTHLDLATSGGHENFVDDFARETLRILGFVERGLSLSMRFMIPLVICGENSLVAPMDVCLIARRLGLRVLLILQEDKTIFSQPEPQVIANAIAAYQYNNLQRGTRGLPALDAMTIPCITMAGTRPTFYLVPVTQALSIAVVTGQYPQTPTNVVKCVTSLGPNHSIGEGMETLEYRRVALQRFIAFKSLAKEYWQIILSEPHCARNLAWLDSDSDSDSESSFGLSDRTGPDD
ncbi:hypothetical protein BGW80DRAFT_1461651 [Lactifluus volemus]|nr:hypothetical protein BGW80DRAFT_1461651 [Lactifluus volemus]